MTLIEPMIFNEVTTAKTLIQGMIFNSAEKTHSNDTAKSPNTVNNNNQPATIIENNIQHTPQIIYTNTATALAAQIPNNHSQAMENSNLTVLKPNNTQIFPKKAQHTDYTMATNRPPQITPYSVAQNLIKSYPLKIVGNGLYFYNGQYYRLLQRDDIFRLIMHTCRDTVEYVGEPQFIKKIYAILFAEPAIYTKTITTNSNLLTFKDGVLDLLNNTFHQHSPSVFSTSILNANYQAGATMYCPQFDNFLIQISGGDQLLFHRLWEMLGYLLTQDMNGKCFFVLQGVSDSGKSKLGEFIRSFYPEELVTSLDIQSFGQNFALADIIGKQLCIDLDLPSDTISGRASSFLKKLTGGDILSTDVKYMPRISFTNTAKILFATNHPIVTATKDNAFWRRLVIIPFFHSIDRSQQDTYLLQRFEPERNSIAVKAIHYYQQLRANNYVFTGNFPPNQVFEKADNSNRDLDSCIANLMLHNCELDEESWISSHDLYLAFSNQYGNICDQKKFSEKVRIFCSQNLPSVEKGRKYSPGSINAVQAYIGIKLKATPNCIHKG